MNPLIPFFTLLLPLIMLVGCVSSDVLDNSNTLVDLKKTSLPFKAEDGYVLPYRSYENEATEEGARGLIIALHGFNDYKNAFFDLCSFFQQENFDCVAFDQRSFGETAKRGIWPEEGLHQSDVLAFVNKFHQQDENRPIYLVGESMGGAVLISAWARFRPELEKKVRGTILLAPAVWARETQPWYQRLALWLAVRVAPSWSPTGQGLEIRASDNNEALIGLGRDPLVIKETRIDAVYGLTNLMDEALDAVNEIPSNTLYVYGLNDQVIPYPATCKALSRLGENGNELGLLLYQEGYHMLTRDLDREQLFKDMLTWIEKPFFDSPESLLAKAGSFCDS